MLLTKSDGLICNAMSYFNQNLRAGGHRCEEAEGIKILE